MTDRLAALRRPRVLLPLLGVLLVLVALFAWDAFAAKTSLENAQAKARAATGALGQGEIQQAAELLEQAEADVADARGHTDGPIWAVAKRVPVLGRTPKLLVRVVDVADVAIGIAAEAVAQGEGFLGDDGSIEVSVTDGKVNLTPLRLAHQLLTTLPTQDLADARQRLADTPDRWIPSQVRDGKRDALELADMALDTLSDATDATGALPAFLGGDGPRRYFLALQNPGELRGTGGLFGYVATIEFDDGQISLGEPASYDIDPISGVSGFTGDVVARRGSVDNGRPVDSPAPYRARYQHVEADSFLANANVHPHLPTTGDVLTRLIEDRTGLELDGLIAMDPYGFQRILRELGAVELPDVGLDLGPIPNPIPPQDFAEVTLVDAYDHFGGPSADRMLFHQVLAGAAFDKFLAGGWDGVKVGRAIGEIASERHLQVYSEHPEEEAAFRRLSFGGSVKPAWEGGDLLGLTANNAAGSKGDTFVAHRVQANLQLRDLRGTSATRAATVGVGVENPLGSTGHDSWILMNLEPRPGNLGIQKEPGFNRTWFTLWTPESTGFTAGREGGQPTDLGAGVIDGLHATDHFLLTPPESSNSFEVDLTGPVELVRDGPDLLYRLTVWRQSKAIPDHLDLSITGPDGWGIAEVVVEGGGDGEGMGVGGTGNERVKVLDTTGNTVRIAGAATQDVNIEIRYSRGLLSRLWGWINAPL